jgi:hypothetical protein
VIPKIISGGQTGADRAALDWAIEHNLPHGGYCPKGRRAEDGTIPPQYRLWELQTDRYIDRTEHNVIDSDGTVILSVKPVLTGGSKEAEELARIHHKPILHLHSESPDASSQLREFVTRNRVQVLNVAGPRASSEPGVSAFVTRVLDEAFG